MVGTRTTPRARASGKGSSATTRARWRATYASRPYDELPWFEKGPSPQVREAVQAGFWPSGGAVLDVGCGAGSNVLWLARSGFEAHGIDLSPGAVRAANSRARKAKLAVDVQEGDVLNLPFPSGRFDGLVDNGCFHTLPIRRRADYAAEIFRILRPGGGFLLAWIAREHTSEFGPPHRPSLREVTEALESRFLFTRTMFRPTTEETGPAAYVAWLTRRPSAQPPAR